MDFHFLFICRASGNKFRVSISRIGAAWELERAIARNLEWRA
jgi:hypothetical protein